MQSNAQIENVTRRSMLAFIYYPTAMVALRYTMKDIVKSTFKVTTTTTFKVTVNAMVSSEAAVNAVDSVIVYSRNSMLPFIGCIE